MLRSPLLTRSLTSTALTRLQTIQRNLRSLNMSSELKPIKLYTAGTPNGYKASIFLEELKAAYPGFTYEFQALSFTKNEQKEPWFLKINPNGRIPAISDPNREDFNVFESAALILYLIQHYDKEYKLSFDPVNEPDAYSEALQWTFFVHGGIGPMQGQANHFFRYAPEKIPYAIKRYNDETRRLYSVLESRLSNGREYLAGAGKGKFSFADVNGFPWVRGHGWAGIQNFEADFPNVKAWLDRIEARPAVYEGLGVPSRGKKMTKEEEEKAAEEARSWILGNPNK